MSKAIHYGFLMLKNESRGPPGLGMPESGTEEMVQKVADEFLNTCIPFLEQGQEDYIMGVFGNIDAGIIDDARSVAIDRLLSAIGGR